MKKIVLLLLLFVLSGGIRATAQPWAEVLTENYDYNIAVDGDAFADNTRRIAAGESVISFQSILSQIVKVLQAQGGEVVALLTKIVAVSILFAVLTDMQQSLEAKNIRDTVFFVCYIVMCTLAIEAFRDAVSTFESAVSSAVLFMNGCVPIMTGLLVTSGKVATAAGVNPIVLTGCALLSNAVRFLIVPVLYCITAMSMVSNISTTVSVSGFAAFLKKTVRWGLCLLLTAFSGLLIVQGFGSGTMDALTAKTARYVVSNGVPVVGGILSDTLDTVAGSAVAIKNATGAAGVISLFTVCVTPIAKIALSAFAFHLAAAVIEPVTDRRIFGAVNSIAEVLSLMVGVLCAVFVMFIICVAMLMRLGG